MITVEGKRYTVLESLGYNHDVGAQVKIVKDGDRERAVVGQRGCWHFHAPQVHPRGPITGQ